MDDISTILYVILGIIYFVYQISRKGKKPQQNNDPNAPLPGNYDETIPDSPENQQKRRPSFEDLLREFTQEEPDDAPPVEVFEEKKAPDPKPYSTEKQTYVVPESSFSQPLTSSFSEGAIGREGSLFKAYEQDDETDDERIRMVEDLKEMLKDPEGIKKAILINEILTPKYF